MKAKDKKAALNQGLLEEVIRPEDRITKKELLAYGGGAIMDGGGGALLACVMLKYMTDGLAIPAFVASSIVMLSKFWDAITDPLMGNISDNTRGKWGRRKPYMFIGGFFIMLATCLLFLPINRFESFMSVGSRIAYVVIFYMFYCTCSTFTQVPYSSLSSEISPSFSERNKANTVKLIGSSLAALLAYVGPLLLLENFLAGKINDIGFWLLIMIFGVVFGAGLIITAIGVKERVTVAPDEPKRKFSFKEYLVPLKVKSFVLHLIMYAAAFMCLDMVSALAIYYALDVWRGATLFGINFTSVFIVAPLMVSAVAAFPVIRKIMLKKNKQTAFIVGLPFYLFGGIMLAVMDPSWAKPWMVVITTFIMGIGFSGAQTMPWIIFPDTIDVAELKLGYRPTGAFSGAMTFIRKFASALGIGMVGWILSGVGYVKSTPEVRVVQSDTVLLTIRLIMGISVAVLIITAFIAATKYKIDDSKLNRVRYFNEKARNGENDTLTAEELAEKEHLINTLAGKKFVLNLPPIPSFKKKTKKVEDSSVLKIEDKKEK